MKGLLLAAGKGTRLRPITYVANKTIIPIYDRPMFFYGLKTIIDAGIKEIIVVTDPVFSNQIKDLVKYFPKKTNVKFLFTIQKKPLGMVDAIKSAKNIVGNSSIFVVPGDNLFSGNYKEYIQKFNSGGLAFIRKVKDPERFGSPYYSKTGRLIKIVEKPRHPQTPFAVGAPYIFDQTVFKKIRLLKPSERSELEITDLMNLYLKDKDLVLERQKDTWIDTGTFQSLLQASNFVSKNKNHFFD